MKIAILTTIYNEALILPYFLPHYAEWDQIRVLVDNETTDNSLEICRRFPNVAIEPCHMTAGINDLEKIDMLQNAFNRMAKEFDWIALVDSDEFIIPPIPNLKVHQFIENNPGYEAFYSHMYRVYKHVTDQKLDPNKAALPQRIHGLGPGGDEQKPNVLKTSIPIKLTIGNHTLGQPLKTPDNIFFTGVHWANADPEISVTRRINRRKRLSKVNLDTGWGIQHFKVTTESIMEEAKSHENDPLIEELKILCGGIV